VASLETDYVKSTLISFVALGMQSEENAPKKWRSSSWFLLHYNVPTHGQVLDKDFLKEQCDNTGASPILF